MDTTWISSATSGMFKYLYNSLTGEDERTETGYRSLNSALCKGMRVTDLPTNNYEPLGARAMAKKVGVSFSYIFFPICCQTYRQFTKTCHQSKRQLKEFFSASKSAQFLNESIIYFFHGVSNFCVM